MPTDSPTVPVENVLVIPLEDMTDLPFSQRILALYGAFGEQLGFHGDPESVRNGFDGFEVTP